MFPVSERVTLDCLECGTEIVFEVEDWADPPERAFCGDECYERHEEAEATATTSAV